MDRAFHLREMHVTRITFAWPQGRAGAVTSSWDDGTVFDRNLIAILNRHGLRGTFNLNSGPLGFTAAQSGWKDYISAQEVATLYAGHEVACHSVSHPFLHRLPDENIWSEVLEDRRTLERLVGYPVRGMALPYVGACDARVAGIIRSAGILYLRAFGGEPTFELPGDFMVWRTTCHQKAAADMWKRFLAHEAPDKVFYVWGHSYEFDNDKNWDTMESFAENAGTEKTMWHATNMQICEYASAWRGLQCSIDMSCVRNLSALSVWFRVEGTLRSIAPGETVVF
jgi:hypothetical protein